MAVPKRPKIYHITHVNNLATIVRDGWLWSDAARIRRGSSCEVVGMSQIKRDRLTARPVSCHPGTNVGQYTPFYFGPRSVMLYLLHRGNHPALDYAGGQQPIVHLRADVHATVRWANASGVRWAFTDRNAAAAYAGFFNDLNQLSRVGWEAVRNRDWRQSAVKEAKQAEFLIFEALPWHLVEFVGVLDNGVVEQVRDSIPDDAHRPDVEIRRTWYY